MSMLAPYHYIPTPLHFGRTPQFSYYCMSLEGPSLYDFSLTIDTGFDYRCINLILYHSLKALQSIHEMGISHSDINLKNICLSVSPTKARLLLVDFGSSIACDEFSRRRDISAVIMCLTLVSNHHDVVSQCRWHHNQDEPSSIEDLLALITEQPNFDFSDPFQWEADRL